MYDVHLWKFYDQFGGLAYMMKIYNFEGLCIFGDTSCSFEYFRVVLSELGIEFDFNDPIQWLK